MDSCDGRAEPTFKHGTFGQHQVTTQVGSQSVFIL